MSYEQRSPEWYAARAGKITASRMCDVLAVAKKDGKPLKARSDYVAELVAERLTGMPMDSVNARALEWGRDVEPAMVAAYEARTGVIVELVDFVTHPQFPFVGCSPDGLVGDDCGIEGKCPFSLSTHLETLRFGMPDDHKAQVQTAMWVTGRPFWDFVSYDPRYPSHLRLYVQHVPRDDIFIAHMQRECMAVEAEVRAALADLSKLGIAA